MSEGMLQEIDTSLSLVTITAPGRNKENGIMWTSSSDRLEMQRKPFHKSNSSDSPCISESGSDIFTKWDVIHKLRRQLKRRDELIMEMQDHITTLQSSLIDQARHSAFLQLQLAATKDLLESEREIQRLRKAVADDCTREIGHPEKLGRKRPVVKRINGYANGFHDGAVDPVDTSRVEDMIEMLKREVGELREELFSKVTELQERLDSQVTTFCRE